MGRGAGMAGGLCGVGQLQQAAGPADPGEDQLWVAQDIIAIIIIIIIIIKITSLQWYQSATAGDGTPDQRGDQLRAPGTSSLVILVNRHCNEMTDRKRMTTIIVISIKMKTTLGFMGRRPAFSSSAAAAASSSCGKRKRTPADHNCFRKVCSSVRLSHLLWIFSSWAAAAASSSRGFDSSSRGLPRAPRGGESKDLSFGEDIGRYVFQHRYHCHHYHCYYSYYEGKTWEDLHSRDRRTDGNMTETYIHWSYASHPCSSAMHRIRAS
jgi:hypothetical protein